MSYIDLATAKKHLNLNENFTADDDYIELIIDGACKAVLATCNLQEEELLQDGGTIPSPIVFATLLLIGSMYANREMEAFTAISKIPTFRFLLANFIKYNDDNFQ